MKAIIDNKIKKSFQTIVLHNGRTDITFLPTGRVIVRDKHVTLYESDIERFLCLFMRADIRTDLTDEAQG
jgi:hypothetical protein